MYNKAGSSPEKVQRGIFSLTCRESLQHRVFLLDTALSLTFFPLTAEAQTSNLDLLSRLGSVTTEAKLSLATCSTMQKAAFHWHLGQLWPPKMVLTRDIHLTKFALVSIFAPKKCGPKMSENPPALYSPTACTTTILDSGVAAAGFHRSFPRLREDGMPAELRGNGGGSTCGIQLHLDNQEQLLGFFPKLVVTRNKVCFCCTKRNESAESIGSEWSKLRVKNVFCPTLCFSASFCSAAWLTRRLTAYPAPCHPSISGSDKISDYLRVTFEIQPGPVWHGQFASLVRRYSNPPQAVQNAWLGTFKSVISGSDPTSALQ